MRLAAHWRAMFAVAAVLALAVVVGCGGDDDSGSSEKPANTNTAPQEAKKGGDLTVMYAGDVDNIDPGVTYYQYGFNDRHLFSRYSRVNTEFQYALDAVVGPNGQVTCRELTRANPNPRAQGCAPMNLFGLDNLSQSAINYAYRPVVEDFLFDVEVPDER